jgi:prepilin signal peptidase PulO-like enzyme (type II secretory pathway)
MDIFLSIAIGMVLGIYRFINWRISLVLSAILFVLLLLFLAKKFDREKPMIENIIDKKQLPYFLMIAFISPFIGYLAKEITYEGLKDRIITGMQSIIGCFVSIEVYVLLHHRNKEGKKDI